MKTMVVGDIHGRTESVQAALNSGYPVVFVGDYLDSFTRKPVEQIQALKLVIEAVKSGQAQALIGNHEVSYLDSTQRCAGWNPSTQMGVDQIMCDSRVTDPETFQARFDTDLLEYYTFCEGFLITHAGVSRTLLESRSQNLAEYLDGGDYLQCSRYRGGSSPVGGLLWCDWREFEPVDGIRQILGHTGGKTIREKDGNYCIDCLEYGEQTVLLIEDGEAEIVSLLDV
jgi:hypothetical protein